MTPSVPLGATWQGDAVHFAIRSAPADAVTLVLFDDEGRDKSRLVELQRADDIWHVTLSDVGPGQLYGYRIHGAYAPTRGMRCNPAKLLLDPYSKAVAGSLQWHDALCPDSDEADPEPTIPDARDSAPYVPKGVVVDTGFDWEGDGPPRTPWAKSMIYECHVKGLTWRHPDVPPADRGTYRGLASEAVIEHLRALHVTAVELLPIHHAVTERRLARHDLTNYWGYNTLAFFAPDARFASGARGEQVREFKEMVKSLHAAGLEVILDVVYNHTAEGNHIGPTLNHRGIDNEAYYLLDPSDRARYLNFTGTGNTSSAQLPAMRQLIVDSLRYWVSDMHVDGFRFDLAAALGRTADGAFKDDFFAAIRDDPPLKDVKLIAEPWDAGHHGYRLGSFPRGWTEWNGKFRDVARKFWRGDEGHAGALAHGLAGSSDIFSQADRGPGSGVNYITCHDGFTLEDLVSYEHKHNEANAEDNHDGNVANWSANWGVEGPTGDSDILAARDRVKRSLLTTLAFAQGVPMLSHGDELGRTQRGNNNAYCQDNETTWVDWSLDPRSRALLEFTRHVFTLRRANRLLRREAFLTGESDAAGSKDVVWLGSDGRELTTELWDDGNLQAFGMLLRNPSEVSDPRMGRSATALLIMNSADRPCQFTLPQPEEVGRWTLLVDTATAERESRSCQDVVELDAHAALFLEWRRNIRSIEHSNNRVTKYQSEGSRGPSFD